MLKFAKFHEVLARTDGTGTVSYLADALGSTIALANGSGLVQTEYTYEPFGRTTATGSTSTSQQQYAGRENDGTGLYFYRARYYNATLQRFISEDPIGFQGGQANLYAYVGNDSVDFIDPFGLDKKKKDFQNCMASHASDFSIVGTANYLWNTGMGRNDNFKDSFLGGVIGGNSITSLLYGGLSDQAGAPLSVIAPAMGTATSYGRRTTTIMSLNLAGKGGVPLALGGPSALKSLLSDASEVLSLGLDLTEKLAVDAGFALAEVAYCSSIQ